MNAHDARTERLDIVPIGEIPFDAFDAVTLALFQGDEVADAGHGIEIDLGVFCGGRSDELDLHGNKWNTRETRAASVTRELAWPAGKNISGAKIFVIDPWKLHRDEQRFREIPILLIVNETTVA